MLNWLGDRVNLKINPSFAAPETVAAIVDLLSKTKTIITACDDSVVILLSDNEPPKDSNKQSGFTTVELLAIVVTIALVAILLFPHLPK